MSDRVPRNVQRQGFTDAQRITLLEQDADDLHSIAERIDRSVAKLGKIATTLMISICTAVFMLGLSLAVGGFGK